jgi:hypothetical protein
MMGLLGFAVAGWLGGTGVWAQPGAARVEVKAGATDLMLATPVELEFRWVRDLAAGGGEWEVPRWGDSLPGGWEVLRVGTMDTVVLEGTEVAWVQAVEVVHWDSGEVVLPALPFVRGGDTVFSEAMAFRVGMPHAEEPDRQAPPAEVVDVQWTWWERLQRMAPYLLGGLAAAALVAWGVRQWRRRKRGAATPVEAAATADVRPPHVVALESLERIQREAAWRAGDEKGFHAQISQVLRVYLEQSLGFPAVERTTTEIRRALPGLALEPQTRTMLVEILEQADLAKFAKHRSPAEVHERMVRQAMRFVEHTAPGTSA